MGYRIGFGIDFHQLAEGREFWLGGVLIPHDRGAVGHSDADVLIHAICDALLGALNLGDIGVHFPNTDPAYKDIDSKILLEKHMQGPGQRIWGGEYRHDCVSGGAEDHEVCRGDAETMAAILQIGADDISIKATTTEQMGFVGRGEGLVAYATVLLER